MGGGGEGPRAWAVDRSGPNGRDAMPRYLARRIRAARLMLSHNVRALDAHGWNALCFSFAFSIRAKWVYKRFELTCATPFAKIIRRARGPIHERAEGSSLVQRPIQGGEAKNKDRRRAAGAHALVGAATPPQWGPVMPLCPRMVHPCQTEECRQENMVRMGGPAPNKT